LNFTACPRASAAAKKSGSRRRVQPWCSAVSRVNASASPRENIVFVSPSTTASSYSRRSAVESAPERSCSKPSSDQATAKRLVCPTAHRSRTIRRKGFRARSSGAAIPPGVREELGRGVVPGEIDGPDLILHVPMDAEVLEPGEVQEESGFLSHHLHRVGEESPEPAPDWRAGAGVGEHGDVVRGTDRAGGTLAIAGEDGD